MIKDRFNNVVGLQVCVEKEGFGKVILVLVVLFFGGGLQVVMQFFVYDFKYQVVFGVYINYIYLLWGIVQWVGKWYGQYFDVFMCVGSIGVMIIGVGFISLVVVKMVLVNLLKVNEYLYGLVCWVNVRDIQVVGFILCVWLFWQIIIGKDVVVSLGVYVGVWIDKKGKQYYLCYNGLEYVFCYVLICFGKGVGLVVFMLLFWGYSVVIIDLKGELWVLMVGWWQKYVKNKVLCFELVMVSGSVCWNLFDEICFGMENEVGDVQNFVMLIVDLDGKGFELYW